MVVYVVNKVRIFLLLLMFHNKKARKKDELLFICSFRLWAGNTRITETLCLILVRSNVTLCD